MMIKLLSRQTLDRGTMMSRHSDLTEAILICVAEVHEEVRAAPPPPKWRSWDYGRYQENLEFGPLYSTIRWFGALAASEAQRVACLRTVYKLAEAGLLEVIKSEWGGKVERVRLTDRGREVVASLRSREEIPIPAQIILTKASLRLTSNLSGSSGGASPGGRQMSIGSPRWLWLACARK